MQYKHKRGNMGGRYYQLRIDHPDNIIGVALHTLQDPIPKLAVARRMAEAVRLLFPKATVKLESVQHVPFYAVIPVTFKEEK